MGDEYASAIVTVTNSGSTSVKLSHVLCEQATTATGNVYYAAFINNSRVNGTATAKVGNYGKIDVSTEYVLPAGQSVDVKVSGVCTSAITSAKTVKYGFGNIVITYE